MKPPFFSRFALCSYFDEKMYHFEKARNAPKNRINASAAAALTKRITQ